MIDAIRVTRFAVVCVTVGACAGDPTGPSAASRDLALPWISAAPTAVGADPGQIERALDFARQQPRLTSVLVVKDGRLVVEQYLRGNHADSLNDVRSVTKSVVSALVGIAIEEGFLGGVDDRIEDYLAPPIAFLPPSARDIRVRHLLTMTGGFEWHESDGGGSYGRWIQSDDHIAHLLDQPLVETPGATFLYNSAAVHLLGVVLRQATGMSVPAFADEYLFGPIGIERARWEALTNGFHNGGAGLDLRPRDLARFGQLFLQGGRSGDRQVVPSEWTTESAAPRFPWRFNPFGPVRDVTYGYLWWVVTGNPEPAYYAWGFGGQFIYVVPDMALVLVATTEWRGVTAEGGPESFESAAFDVLVGRLLPAFR